MGTRASKDPDITYRVRDPETGMILGPRVGGKWSKKSWRTGSGLVFPSRTSARRTIEQYLLNTGDRSTPLEIVELRLVEVASTAQPYVGLDALRNFFEENGKVRLQKSPLQHVLSGPVGKFIFSAFTEDGPPKFIAVMDQNINPMKALNIRGRRQMIKNYRNLPRTVITLMDDASAVALKLAHSDEMAQLWDFATGSLIEGDPHFS